MKFYYKGYLLRTSKSKDYKFAVVSEVDDAVLYVYSCHTTQSLAERACTIESLNAKRAIDSWKRILNDPSETDLCYKCEAQKRIDKMTRFLSGLRIVKIDEVK